MLPPKVIEKLGRRIEKLKDWRYAWVADVPLEMAETMQHLRRPPAELSYVPAPIGCTWGTHWGTTWFRGRIDIPKSLKGHRVFYRHQSHTDKLLWLDGESFAGMNHGHEEVLLHGPAKGGESHEIYVEAYTGHLMPGMDPNQDRWIEIIERCYGTAQPFDFDGQFYKLKQVVSRPASIQIASMRWKNGLASRAPLNSTRRVGLQ